MSILSTNITNLDPIELFWSSRPDIRAFDTRAINELAEAGVITKHFVVPDQIRHIYRGAFANDASDMIEEISLPSGVVVHDEAFVGCENLQKVSFRGCGFVHPSAFGLCPLITHLEVPRGTTRFSKKSLLANVALEELVLFDTLEKVDPDIMAAVLPGTLKRVTWNGKLSRAFRLLLPHNKGLLVKILKTRLLDSFKNA